MILLTIAGALVLFLGYGFYQASKLQEIHIQKKVDIKATLQSTFDNVVYFKNFTKWSPFYEEDPQQKTQIKGTDGAVGAQFHWEGNKGKDLGYQEIKQITPLKNIKMECTIEKPFKAQPKFEYSFTKTNSGVQVVQDFYLKSGLVDSFFMWLFGAKKGMEKMNGRGMELLKLVNETPVESL